MLVKAHFDAAHHLPGYPGKCAGSHGHTWKIEVVVRGRELNEIGLVYDFAELKKQVDDVLDRLDHKYLNEVPPFDAISPTGENLAAYLFGEIAAKLPDAVEMAEVRVWESDSACLIYRGD